MEKVSTSLLRLKQKHKLPVINKNNSKIRVSTKSPHLLISPPEHLKDLRKLYYQYKSNANILTHSPYYTNRQHKQNVVSYIQANKCQPTPEQLKIIEERFSLAQQTSENVQVRQSQTLEVSLHCFSVVIHCKVNVKTVEQLEILLKKQFAMQELKSEGSLRKVDQIGGFTSYKANQKINFVLSQKSNSLPSGSYELKPWLYAAFSGTIHIKDFKIIRCLGSGGFSLVYLARDRIKGNLHALKLIDKSFILQSQREMIIENERFVLGELKDSPFITPLRFCLQTKNHFAFAIEYCPGGELFYQLKKVKRMTEQQARFYFLQILTGLDHLHQKNIIYRDLKPQNLLIGSDGHIRIADFGLAKPLLGREAAYSFCGSPEYMAPEMLKKSGHGTTIDYYCLGALLYQLVVGVPPYYSLNHQEIYQGVLYQELTFPQKYSFSNEIINLLTGLLQKDPSKRIGSRYGAKEIMIHPWVGRTSRKDIEEKKLVPPFLPDISNFNFDETDLEERNKETQKKVAEDMRCTSFQTHFNQQFYFADPAFLPQISMKKPITKRSLKVRSLEKGRKSGSMLRRVESERGKSK